MRSSEEIAAASHPTIYTEKRKSFILVVSYSFIEDYDDHSDHVVDDDASSVLVSATDD
jgi:hypothetical protein